MKTISKVLIPVWVLFALSCGPSLLAPPDSDLISQISSGSVSRHDPITIVFNHAVPGAEAGRELAVSPFETSPGITGKTLWRDARTLDFLPENGLAPDTQYSVVFRPDLIGLEAPLFGFSLQTPRPDLLVEPGLLKRRADGYSLEVVINSADRETGADVLKAVYATLKGEELRMEITEGPSNRHILTFPELKPQASVENLILSWNSSALGGKLSGQKSISIPGVHDFTFLGYKIESWNGALTLSFSQPIDPSQKIQGLVNVDGASVTTSVNGGVIQVFSPEPWPETVAFTVEPTLRSIENKNLALIAEGTVSRARRLPSVAWTTKGVIIPPDTDAVLPIKTINLRGVVVEAIQIFEDNVTQFLQVNRLDGARELIRVGRPVWRSAVALPFTMADVDKELEHVLDLRPLLQKFPGGMFHLRVSFLPNHVEYPFTGGYDLSKITADTLFPRLSSGEESSYWDYYGEGYDWEEISNNRENPSHPVFYVKTYNHDISINRNVLISHIGLLVKRGEDKNISVWATDIRTTVPLTGAQIQIFDYQGQKITEGPTNPQGNFTWKAGEIDPAFVVATHGGRKSYLRVNDGSALSISHFDVKGDQAESGLKGFIYGERGVWRPGDTIYLTFILLDPMKTLPQGHPVVLELIDPNGSRFTRSVVTQGRDGFYHFPVATQTESPTGNWVANITAGGRRFSYPVKVETVVPNRLKSELSLGKALASGLQNFSLTGSWLHGAPATNLNADIALNLTAKPTAFQGFSEFSFDDPLRSFSFTETQLWKGALDATGRAQISADFPDNLEPPGKLSANLKVRIYEPSGAFSTESISADFDAYNSYVGVQLPPGDAARGMLLTDTDHKVRLIALTPVGALAGNHRVKVELFKLGWRWWWEGGSSGGADFESRNSMRAVQNQTVNLVNGRGEWTLRVNYPEWGRFFVRTTDLESGHSSGKVFYIDWPNWAGRAAEGSDGAAMLVLGADKATYAPGETITVSFPSAAGSRALAVVESGGKVLKGEWLETTAGTTLWKFRAEAGMAPNVFAHVSLVQPYAQRANDRPIRLYGIIPININDPGSRITPVISSLDTFEPQSTQRIVVSEASGRPMTYTLALVDEGLLGLTGFKTPNPWDTFYRREASRLRSFDFYDFIAGAYAGRIQNMIRIGGSGDIEEGAASRLGRYPPVVRYVGPAELAAGARNTHEIELPMYVGAVRLMVVGASRGTAFGKAEKTVTVKKELMVQATLPRVLGPGEESDYPVTVFWTGTGATNVNVTVQLTGAATAVGPAAQLIRFPAPGEQTVRFKIKASETVGTIQAKATAVASTFRSEHVINMQTRLPTQPVFQVTSRTLAARQSLTETLTPIGMPGTGKLTLEISRLIPMDLSRRLAYLIRYPYGCVEQITSSVFPQVYLDKIMDISSDDRARIQTNITAAIDRLRSYQAVSGGFLYWPGANAINDWASSYVGHFLLEAKNAGFFVPPEMISKWSAYQAEVASTFSKNNNYSLAAQAYRLYTLSRSGKPDIGAMNRLREQSLDGVSQLQLAVAYKLAGETQAATALAARASLVVPVYKSTGDNFGSTLRDKAIILEALTEMNDLDRAGVLAREVANLLISSEYHNTQAIAYALVSISRFSMKVGGASGMEGSYSWRGGNPVTFRSTEKLLMQIVLPPGTGPGQLVLNSTVDAPLYARFILEGQPRMGEEPSVTQGIAAVVRYNTPEGGILQTEQLELGTDVIITVELRNMSQNKLENVALSWYAPAGWEISNPRMSGGRTNSGVDYEDYRDDRVDSFFTLDARQGKTMTFRATTAYGGRFYLPALYVGPMYDPAVQAVIPGRWVNVGRVAAPATVPRPR